MYVMDNGTGCTYACIARYVVLSFRNLCHHGKSGRHANLSTTDDSDFSSTTSLFIMHSCQQFVSKSRELHLLSFETSALH